jgi:hypothetical protein
MAGRLSFYARLNVQTSKETEIKWVINTSLGNHYQWGARERGWQLPRGLGGRARRAGGRAGISAGKFAAGAIGKWKRQAFTEGSDRCQRHRFSGIQAA